MLKCLHIATADENHLSNICSCMYFFLKVSFKKDPLTALHCTVRRLRTYCVVVAKTFTENWVSKQSFFCVDIDTGLNFFCRIKTFLFFKIESWNVQQFEKKIVKPHKISTQSKRIEKMIIKIVWMSWMSWNFARFHKILFQTGMLKVSAVYLKKQKSFNPF